MTRKTMTFLAAAALTAAAFIALFPSGKRAMPEQSVSAPPARSVSERFDYFASHGWEVEELSCKDITIPSNFTGGYEQYAKIQDSQGLSLRKCAGKQAQLYVYQVRNYSPGSRNMLAELIVCENSVVASLIYSEDGTSCQTAVS